MIVAGNIDPFARALLPRLEEDVAKRMTALASGSAARNADEAATTGEKYAGQTMYIKAMNDVIDLIHEIETEMYGGKKAAEEQG